LSAHAFQFAVNGISNADAFGVLWLAIVPDRDGSRTQANAGVLWPVQRIEVDRTDMAEAGSDSRLSAPG
jgi:hypothetical protein